MELSEFDEAKALISDIELMKRNITEIESGVVYIHIRTNQSGGVYTVPGEIIEKIRLICLKREIDGCEKAEKRLSKI